MKSVKLLKILSHHYNHLQGQPIKVLVDILSQVRGHTWVMTSGFGNIKKSWVRSI